MTILFYLKPHHRRAHIGPDYPFKAPKKRKVKKVYKIIKEGYRVFAKQVSMKEVAQEFIVFQKQEKLKAKRRQEEEEAIAIILLL